MKINQYYKIKGYNKPLKYLGLIEGDYTCDCCNERHYNRVLPKLHCFEIDGDNIAKYGTACIKQVLEYCPERGRLK